MRKGQTVYIVISVLCHLSLFLLIISDGYFFIEGGSQIAHPYLPMSAYPYSVYSAPQKYGYSQRYGIDPIFETYYDDIKIDECMCFSDVDLDESVKQLCVFTVDSVARSWNVLYLHVILMNRDCVWIKAEQNNKWTLWPRFYSQTHHYSNIANVTLMSDDTYDKIPKYTRMALGRTYTNNLLLRLLSLVFFLIEVVSVIAFLLLMPLMMILWCVYVKSFKEISNIFVRNVCYFLMPHLLGLVHLWRVYNLIVM